MPPSVQEEKRKLAIRLWKKGHLQKAIAETVGVSPQSVTAWIKRYKAEGASSLKARKREPDVGSTRHLTPEQERRLQQLICDKTPEQIKLDYALWTRQAVMELIQ